ncbi:MAG: L,D-transpeptidase family protein [Bacteroides sp.]|nr:L,D-transpeptidase family protein [Bacteroides sp.]MCM1550824.1 L,D-transpeptidase family protein [Clostridium sp.]
MKIQKKIGLTLILLSILTLSGFGVLWGLEQRKGTVAPYDSNMDSRMPTQSVDEISINQTNEIVDSDIAGGDGRRLVDLEDYSEAPSDNGCPYYIKVNRLRNTVTIYGLDSKGYYTVPIKAMICSVGEDDGTPLGTFQTSDRHPWCALVGNVYGQYAYRISGPIMFHSVPYYSMNKDDLETEEYNKLGEAASLGCVRLSVSDAKWIYDNCPAGTIVTIYDNEYAGPLGKPSAEVLDVKDERSVWDPTDPDTENPWNEGKPRILGGGTRVIERGCTYQSACGVLALDGDGTDITSQIITEGLVDAMTVGDYPVTYHVQGKRGKTDTVAGVIRVVDTIPPELKLEADRITLNRAEAAEANCITRIQQYVTAVDMGEELEADCLDMDLSNLSEQGSGQFSIVVRAVDSAGNRSKPVAVTVLLDREPPVIHEPAQKAFTAVSDEDLEEQLQEAIKVEDNYSGVDQVHVSWVKEGGADTYMLLVTARDGYGNVSSEFFYDFLISYESGE